MASQRAKLVLVALVAMIGLTVILGGSTASAQGPVLPTPVPVKPNVNPPGQGPATGPVIAATPVPPTPTKIAPTVAAPKVVPTTKPAALPRNTRSGPPGNWTADFTLFNLSSTVAASNVTLTRYTGCTSLTSCTVDTGTGIVPSGFTGTIAANGSLYYNPADDASFPSNFSGSVVVTSGSPLAGTITLANGLTGANYASDAYSAVTSPATTVYLPIIMANLGGPGWNTRVIIQNAGGSNANATITYVGSGAPGVTTISNLPPNQSAIVDQADSGVTGFNGSAIVTSTNGQNLAVIVEEYKSGGGTLMAYNGVASTDADTTVYMPGYLDQSPWVTDFTIVNTGGGAATGTTIEFAGSSASLSCTVPANGSLYLIRSGGVPSGCSGSFPTNYYGAATVKTTSGQKLVVVYNIGDAGLGNHRTEAYVGFPSSGAAQTIIVPLIENMYGSGWLTTFSVQSVDGSTPTLQLTYSGNKTPTCNPCDGGMTGPSKTFDQSKDGHVPTGFIGGVRIVSNKNIVVIADQDNKANPGIKGGDTAAGFVGFKGQ